MHHSLHLYGQHQHRLLHLYISLASWARIPLIGWIVRTVANTYARLGHSGYYLALSEAEKIVDLSDNVLIGPCSCRKEFHNCSHAVMSEIVLSRGARDVYKDRQREFRAVTKDEAKSILRQAHAEKLTQSIMRCGDNYYAICNCCSCCCVPTRLRHDYGIGKALVRNPNIIVDYQNQQLN